jgi:hypothetical protein
MEGFSVDYHQLGGYSGPWSWWQRKIPESWRIYGEPIRWAEPNLDFLAAALGELPPGLVYHPAEDRFYFKDYLHKGAYRPTSKDRVEALARKLVVESLKEAPGSIKEASRLLFQSARGWMERSKAILAVEGHFFTGEGGHRRWIEGRFVEAPQKPSIVLFAENCIQRKKGCILSAPDAYQFYSEFCSNHGIPADKKTAFRINFAKEVKKRWKLGLRNDLKVPGKTLQGWGELAVE